MEGLGTTWTFLLQKRIKYVYQKRTWYFILWNTILPTDFKSFAQNL